MRSDPIHFATANVAPTKRPRFVVAILFDVGSIYVTSHGDIPSVPGIVISSALKAPSAISQRIVPDEGRSEIGSFAFSLVDLGESFTDEVRDKLGDGKGLRGKTVQLWVGFEGFDFTAFQLFQTQIITGCEFLDGVYSVRCSDITREQRQDICEPVSTTLQVGCSSTDTTIQVLSTSAFEPVVHGAGWSDAPSATVYYFRIQDEIIRATGKTSGSFTGCTRGVFNTLAVAHTFDAATVQERRPKVEEYIYLELPAPKLAYAILTGIIYGTSDTLPDHWHLGIDPALVRTADFTGIGPDLWDTSDDTRGFLLRFEGLKRQDGKRFLERQIYLLLGAYSPIYSDGAIGLRRLPAMVSDASPVATLSERELVSVGSLTHDYASVHNRFQIDWSFDTTRKEYTRRTGFIDATSVSIHGASPIMKLEFLGLSGALHTDEIIRRRIDSIRDAYAYPPQRLTADCLPGLNRLEVGDVVRVAVSNLRDFAGEGDAIDRAFLILRRSLDFASGELSLELFGSTLRPSAEPPGSGATPPLPDGFYNAAGVALNTVIGMTGNTVNAGTHTINGAATLGASGSIFYHLGDLTIPDGAVINITGNVQLRVRGFVTLNGDINGTGGGRAGVSDGGGAITSPIPGSAGFIGNSRGGDGISVTQVIIRPLSSNTLETVPAALTQGAYQSFPDLDLRVEGTSLVGLPSDLRGTGGGPGGRVLLTGSLASVGGAGAAGGAGLAILCRGMSTGASASITLDGASATPPAAHTGILFFDHFPGTGGAGAPGALLIGLDGNALSTPNIAGRFFARTGAVAIQGYPMPGRAGRMFPRESLTGNPWYRPRDSEITGYLDEAVISEHDYSDAAFRTFYLVGEQTPVPDADVKPPPLTGLVATGESGFNAISVTPPARSSYDFVELWASIDNNRANAVRVGRGDVNEFKHELPVLAARWYWGRVGDVLDGGREVLSDWYPSGATSGVSATTLNPGGWTPVARGGGGATVIATATTIEKSGGTGAWDSDCYSREAFPDGAMVSFRAAQTSASLMVALNSDPATDQSHTSLDFAWYLYSGNHQIYENGSPATATLGAYDTSTIFAIREIGGVVQYLRNGTIVRAVKRKGRQPLALDTSFNTPGGKVLDVHFAAAAARPAVGNLLSVDLWNAGALAGDFGAWQLNQSTANENQIINSIGPHGVPTLVWECRCQDPGFGTGGEQNGGWNNAGDITGLDATKTHRSVVWVRARGSTGNSLYHGCGTSGDTVNLDGSPNSNPYFQYSSIAASGLALDKWYLSVGFIHGSGYSGGNSGLSGLYDPTTGRIVFPALEYKMAAGATTQMHRAYMYYGGDTATRLDFTGARFEEVNGNEPSIAALLVPPDADNTDKNRIVPDAEFQRSIVKGSFWDWVNGNQTVSLQATGGVVAGLLRVVCGGATAANIYVVRRPTLRPLVTLTEVQMTLRVRRTTSVVSGQIEFYSWLYSHPQMDGAGSRAGSSGNNGRILDAAAISAWTVNEWQEYRWTVILLNNPKNAGQFPYCLVELNVVGTSGTIEFDAIDVTEVAATFSSQKSGSVPSPVTVTGKRLADNGSWSAVAAAEIAQTYTDADTSTSFTVGSGHAETIRRFTSSSAITVTLPNSVPSGWAVGQSMVFIRGGTGTLTFTSSGTIRSPGGSAIFVQNGKCCVTLAASGVWELSGNV